MPASWAWDTACSLLLRPSLEKDPEVPGFSGVHAERGLGTRGLTLRHRAPLGPVTSALKNSSSPAGLKFWEGEQPPAGLQEPAHSFQEESALVIH